MVEVSKYSMKITDLEKCTGSAGQLTQEAVKAGAPIKKHDTVQKH